MSKITAICPRCEGEFGVPKFKDWKKNNVDSECVQLSCPECGEDRFNLMERDDDYGKDWRDMI